MHFNLSLSPGDFFDRLTILSIKAERITSPERQALLQRELQFMHTEWALVRSTYDVVPLVARLRTVNERIWDLENRVRDCERRQSFGAEFVSVARGIYQRNDERAAIKREIDTAMEAEFPEQKHYTTYSKVS